MRRRRESGWASGIFSLGEGGGAELPIFVLEHVGNAWISRISGKASLHGDAGRDAEEKNVNRNAQGSFTLDVALSIRGLITEGEIEVNGNGNDAQHRNLAADIHKPGEIGIGSGKLEVDDCHDVDASRGDA